MAEIDGSALLDAAAVMSPAFPTGAFAFSHGLERAVHDGLVRDRDGLERWLASLLTNGSGWNDAVLFAAAWHGDSNLAELGAALAGGRERAAETLGQGRAFVDAAAAWEEDEGQNDGATPYPVVAGRFLARRGVPLEAALALFLQAWVSNLIQAALRLLPFGQSAGVRTLSALRPVVIETAARAATSTLDDLGSATVMSEIAALRHETQYSRLFRS